MQDKARPVGWGIVGAGPISDTTVGQIRNSALARAVAVSSRSEAKAAAFAAKHNIRGSYGSLEALLANTEVEAVYIGLPHALHKDAVLQALDAGKHVLCEKPMGLDAAEIAAIAAHPRAADLLVSEGYMVRYHPQWQWVEEQIRNGALGKIRSVHAFTALTVPRSPPDPSRTLLPGDGSLLLDIACYSVHLARAIYRCDPLRVSAAMEYDPASGRDVFVEAQLRFAEGYASITVSSTLRRNRRIHVLGTEGNLEIMTPVHAPPGGQMRILAALKGDGNGDPQEMLFPAVEQYGLEVEAFSRAVREGSRPLVTLENALGNSRTLDAIRRSAEAESAWIEL